jgi:hypothetical protein
VKIEGFERKSTSTLETKKDQREREREREREGEERRGKNGGMRKVLTVR